MASQAVLTVVEGVTRSIESTLVGFIAAAKAIVTGAIGDSDVRISLVNSDGSIAVEWVGGVAAAGVGRLPENATIAPKAMTIARTESRRDPA
ncbi:MAG: hypothetical protein ABIV26_03645 [Candidatus Limnocylindrales bacterium]